MNENDTIAVIGAGPVGLAAAAHLVGRSLKPMILEQADHVGAAIGQWGHVRVFSPWKYNIDEAATALLDEMPWMRPNPEDLPTGTEIVRDYLAPLAAHPAIAPHLILGARVTQVMREGRADQPLTIAWRGTDNVEHSHRVRAVIDASGTWGQPNPMGVNGGAVPGETQHSDRIAYGIPDIHGASRAEYAGRRVLVVGGGHSAVNVVLDLVRLRKSTPETEIVWALRSERVDKRLGGGSADQLPARGALGDAARQAVDSGTVTVLAPFAAQRIAADADNLIVDGRHGTRAISLDVDRVVVATGFRPDFSMLEGLSIAIDPVVEAPPALASLIDPALHSCGTVPPHGARELAHPEPGFYIVGAKSYGRAPTFLMMTGYEQVRSVVAEIAGDHAAANDVRLILPETGVCSAVPQAAPQTSITDPPRSASGCCGGPEPVSVDACCVKDAEAKTGGATGCGCSVA
ncbi:NAD(P)-binding domain-containing protein [Fodinicurvata sp. EGI_FJ10296]|uniref:NAD(P)-binding domain-containing protein n=1 Tax=Fodinicurvata sp. EGI_FJ10296 TaxID=3231908 RepID=UPI0034511F33